MKPGCTIVAAAEESGRTLLVEMQFAQHPAWLELAVRTAPRLPILSILPTGGVHPIAGPPVGTVV